jgi:hypothetical protein
MKKSIVLLCLLLAYAYFPIQAQNGDIATEADSVNHLSKLKNPAHTTELKTTFNLFVGSGMGYDTFSTSYIAGFTLYDKHMATTIRYIQHESSWLGSIDDG